MADFDLLAIIRKLQEDVKALQNQRALGKTTYDTQGSNPVSPTTGKVVLYFKSDGKLYYKRDDGTVKEVATV